MDCRQQVEAGNTLRKWVQQRGGDTQVAALEQNLHAQRRPEKVPGSEAVEVPGPRESENRRGRRLLEPSPTRNENTNYCHV
jgi:hypothetical protein